MGVEEEPVEIPLRRSVSFSTDTALIAFFGRQDSSERILKVNDPKR
jgi:hypothetical protein